MKKTILLFTVLCLLGGCSKPNADVSNEEAQENTQEVAQTTEETSQEVEKQNDEVTFENFRDFPESNPEDFSGELTDDGYVITSYNGSDKVIVVPKEIDGKKVVGLDNYSLSGNDICEAIVLPDTVEFIGDHAFNMDRNLKYIYLGTGLKEIGFLPFENCSIETVYFYEGLTYMEAGFAACKKVTDVWIPASLTEIPKGIAGISSCPNMVVHTPAGSIAEADAESHGIPVVNDYDEYKGN